MKAVGAGNLLAEAKGPASLVARRLLAAGGDAKRGFEVERLFVVRVELASAMIAKALDNRSER